MQLEKINISELSKLFTLYKNNINERPFEIIENKINEIIDVLNEKKELETLKKEFDKSLDTKQNKLEEKNIIIFQEEKCEFPCQHKYRLKKDSFYSKKDEIFSHSSAIHMWVFIETKSEKFEDYFEKVVKNDWEKEADKEFGYLVDESGSCDDLEKIKQFIHNLLK